MLAALLTNLPITPEPPPPQHARGGGAGRRRRPNEPVIWCDDEIKYQEELTEFKAKPEDEQKLIVVEAVEAVKASGADYAIDAQEAIAELQTTNAILAEVECLNILLLAYFELRLMKQRENDDIAAMLMLGVL